MTTRLPDAEFETRLTLVRGRLADADYAAASEGDERMAPGHVYTVEPDIYTEEAGYRHSDTVAVTEDGTETLTYYPRDLESNVIR